MSLSSHLSELRKKHQALSEIIEEEQRKPSSDDLNIKQLKLKKLHLKEEIERLAAQARPDRAPTSDCRAEQLRFSSRPPSPLSPANRCGDSPAVPRGDHVRVRRPSITRRDGLRDSRSPILDAEIRRRLRAAPPASGDQLQFSGLLKRWSASLTRVRRMSGQAACAEQPQRHRAGRRRGRRCRAAAAPGTAASSGARSTRFRRPSSISRRVIG